jgi:short-subunit dehydrogenase
MLRSVLRRTRICGPPARLPPLGASRCLAAVSAGRERAQVVVISGASGGIGEEVGLLYAKKGAKLILAARSLDKLTAVAEGCQLAGAFQTEIMRCDVSKEKDCKDLVAFAVETYGAIDVLVLNAGLGQVS